jgi:hypothetical protein
LIGKAFEASELKKIDKSKSQVLRKFPDSESKRDERPRSKNSPTRRQQAKPKIGAT